MRIYELENIMSAFDRLADMVAYNKISCDIGDLVDRVEDYINAQEEKITKLEAQLEKEKNDED